MHLFCRETQARELCENLMVFTVFAPFYCVR
jgi:hypothetical protein